MADVSQLPHILRLLDDPSESVRTSVLRALAEFGAALGPALQALPAPPDAERLAEVLAEVEAWRQNGQVQPLFRVGQVVRHKRFGYRGLVVATDAACRGPGSGTSANQPWYHLLVHGSDSVTYTSQASLEPDGSQSGVRHPMVSRYFRGFQNGHYLRNDVPWDGN